MNFAAALRSAWRSLAANALRSALTMLGIMIGVAAVITMVAVGQGATNRVQEQMHGLGYTDKSDIWSLGCIAYVKHFFHCIFVTSRAGTRWPPSPRRSTQRTTLSCSAW